ncbi:uncharacterized protein LOC123509070 [Portunus trituberculatus]|uniref:uncharacterized protein LOC123509065 n=1 Tax=Portunus trituberculatus TaxID=210409 RepID=UPI001E1CF4BC|nr:uncharacterized protein LOC123509065 [Portunus trituberculatus]XP_045119124.1 uncharacterized protein LOC123509070 [Portunus trituberculatus]
MHTTPLSLIPTKGGSAPHLMQDVLHRWRGVEEAPLCVPAHHFTEHMKVLQSFKKGGTHTLLHYKLLEVQRHTAHFFPKRVCRVQDRVARMEDASTFTASLVHAFYFFCVCVCGKKCTQF